MAERNIQTLACTVCKSKGYHYQAGKKRADKTKVEVSKFCKNCRKHTPHKESKSS
jgi:large subunit ribosomal protein L33